MSAKDELRDLLQSRGKDGEWNVRRFEKPGAPHDPKPEKYGIRVFGLSYSEIDESLDRIRKIYQQAQPGTEVYPNAVGLYSFITPWELLVPKDLPDVVNEQQAREALDVINSIRGKTKKADELDPQMMRLANKMHPGAGYHMLNGEFRIELPQGKSDRGRMLNVALGGSESDPLCRDDSSTGQQYLGVPRDKAEKFLARVEKNPEALQRAFTGNAVESLAGRKGKGLLHR